MEINEISNKKKKKKGSNPSQAILLQATEFLKQELPVRLAHRVIELDNLPQNLNSMPSISRVRSWYVDSFRDLVSLPKIHYPQKIKLPPMGAKQVFYPDSIIKEEHLPENVKEINAHFVDAIEKIKKRHDPVTTTIGSYFFRFLFFFFSSDFLILFLKKNSSAQGIKELKEKYNVDVLSDQVQSFLDRFHLSRIGIRFLIGQHIALNKSHHPNYVGIICTKTNISEIGSFFKKIILQQTY